MGSPPGYQLLYFVLWCIIYKTLISLRLFNLAHQGYSSEFGTRECFSFIRMEYVCIVNLCHQATAGVTQISKTQITHHFHLCTAISLVYLQSRSENITLNRNRWLTVLQSFGNDVYDNSSKRLGQSSVALTGLWRQTFPCYKIYEAAGRSIWDPPQWCFEQNHYYSHTRQNPINQACISVGKKQQRLKILEPNKKCCTKTIDSFSKVAMIRFHRKNRLTASWPASSTQIHSQTSRSFHTWPLPDPFPCRMQKA